MDENHQAVLLSIGRECIVKKIKVRFLDFGKSVYLKDHIVNILEKKYDLDYVSEPDYIFYSLYSDENLEYRTAVKIFVTEENVAPDFNICDYAIGPEKITYADRYLRFPVYCFDRYKTSIQSCVATRNFNENILSSKTEFCSFVYSNYEADPIRERLFNEISKYRHVNSGGRYMNNIGVPEGVSDKLEFQSKHKFCISCENSTHPGYTTEKLTEAYMAHCVPIYWGDPDVDKVFNPRSMINVMKFETLDDVVLEIKRIDNDTNAYLKMLNEPPLLDANESYECKNYQLTVFLDNILEQEKEQAFRRNMLFWGKNYYNKLAKWKRSYDILSLNNRYTKKARCWLQSKYHMVRKRIILSRKQKMF